MGECDDKRVDGTCKRSQQKDQIYSRIYLPFTVMHATNEIFRTEHLDGDRLMSFSGIPTRRPRFLHLLPNPLPWSVTEPIIEYRPSFISKCPTAA